MPSRRLFLSLWWLTACASHSAAVRAEPAEPEGTETPAPPPAEGSAGTDHDQLASAFDEEDQQKAPKPIEHNVTQSGSPEATAPPMTPARESFEQAWNVAKPQLSAGGKDALAALKELEPLAQAAGSEAMQQIWEAQSHVLWAKKDKAGAIRAAEKWLKSCGPTHVDACRRRALAALSAPGPSPKATLIQKQDSCLHGAESGPKGRAPPCVSAAQRFYQQQRDVLMVQRALFIKVMGRGPDMNARAFSEAERACPEARCVELRRRVLRQAASWALGANLPKDAADFALKEMKLSLEALPPHEQTYARTPLVDRACAALDAKDGPGACRKLEREVLGRNIFRDFSKEAVASEGLPPERVKMVNDHFGFLMQDCLAEEAGRIEPNMAERYVVRWTVLNDGRVDGVHLDKKSRDDGPLAQCLRTQFAVWRYPRYQGEYQHVEQSFLVSPRERHSMPEATR